MERISNEMNLYEICKVEDEESTEEQQDGKKKEPKPVKFGSYRELMRYLYIVPLSTIKQNDFMQKQLIKDIQKESKKNFDKLKSTVTDKT